MITRHWTRKVGLFLPLILVLNACGKEKEKDAAPCAAADAVVAEANFQSLWTNVFSGRCGTCHGVGATGTQGGPDLRTKEAFYANMVGKTLNDYDAWDQAQTNISGCGSTSLIKAGSAAASLIVATLDASSATVPCTVKAHKEPPQNICISSGSLANLKKWIDAGAPQ